MEMERWYSEKLAAFPALMARPGVHVGELGGNCSHVGGLAASRDAKKPPRSAGRHEIT